MCNRLFFQIKERAFSTIVAAAIYTELIKHKIIKEVLKSEKISNQIEITTLTDIPAKTGLGSSGSFTACLLKSVYSYKKKIIDVVVNITVSDYILLRAVIGEIFFYFFPWKVVVRYELELC